MTATAVGGLLAAGSSAAGTVVYDGLPSPLPVPGNVVSLGYEATSTSEFGDKITLAAGPRILSSVDLLLSSWACESGSWTTGCSTTPGATFTHDITLNIYGTDLSLIGSVTQTFTIPYRPSTNAVCGDNRWSNGTNCFNGYAALVTFNSAALQSITLPDTFIFGVAYDTSHYGADPIGNTDPRYLANTPYDSLNVGLTTSGPSIGTDVSASGAYLSSTWGGANGAYCDGGAGGLGSFREDEGCWEPYSVAIKFNTTAPAPVPVPAAVWLLGSGLIGLVGLGRRRRQ